MARGGKYRIIAHVRGGEVTETSLVLVESGPLAGQVAVMERLKLGDDAEPALLERLGEEAALCKRLEHPNLVRLLEAGRDGEGPVLVFEYLEGPTLARLRSRAARRGGGMPIALALRIVHEIAKGLAYAHGLADEAGKPLKIVHRNVSPESVSVTYDGGVKVGDFDMATTGASTSKSREERVKGNIAYMAPEQARAEFALDSRADLFPLGVILWELLTGKRLWEGLSEVDVLARLADDAVLPSARSVVPTVPEAVDALCTQLLTKVRDERLDSATDFLEALEKVTAKPELQASAEDLAAFVTTLFDDERTKMRALVDEARAPAPEATPQPLPAIGNPRPAEASPFVDVESDPKLRFGVVPAEEAPVERVIEIVEIATPSSDRRFAFAMAALVLIVVGVVAIIVVKSPPEEKKIEDKPYVPPTRPSASPPEPSASGVVEPEEVSIEIRVTPLEAKLFVDGVKANNPYRTRVLPAKFQHAIRAEAEGFETRNQTVAFDRERSIEIALTPLPPKPPGFVRPPAPKPPAPAPKD